MTISHSFPHSLTRPRLMRWATVSAALTLVLTGCSVDQEPEEPRPDDPEMIEDVPNTVRVGLLMNTPGLINGTHPDNASGAEVDLIHHLIEDAEVFEQLTVAWQSASPGEPSLEDLREGHLDVVIGHLNGRTVTDAADEGEGITWIGPYAMTEPALLVAASGTASSPAPSVSPAPSEEPAPEDVPVVISELTDLSRARVCLVEGSLSDVENLPVMRSVTPQSSYAECGTGMNSGQFDAIAGDAWALAALAGTDVLGSAREDAELMRWTELVADEDEDTELSEQLSESSGYWIGLSQDLDAQVCQGLADALEDLVGNRSGLRDVLTTDQLMEGFRIQTPTPDDLEPVDCSSPEPSPSPASPSSAAPSAS